MTVTSVDLTAVGLPALTATVSDGTFAAGEITTASTDLKLNIALVLDSDTTVTDAIKTLNAAATVNIVVEGLTE